MQKKQIVKVFNQKSSINYSISPTLSKPQILSFYQRKYDEIKSAQFKLNIVKLAQQRFIEIPEIKVSKWIQDQDQIFDERLGYEMIAVEAEFEKIPDPKRS